MNIHEHQAKGLLARYGVAVAKGSVAFTVDEAEKVANELGGPVWVVKAQIHAGGRGKGGGVKIVKSIDEAVGLVNKIAPEHLVCDRSDIARRTTRAGTILIGPYGAQAAGDYATGSNHVLPTGGAAQFRGGLSASDFVHIHSVQRISRKGLSTLSPAIVSLAEAEGLTAHAESVKVRMARAKSGGRANRPIH